MKKAFTLIELLVVISIIALLSSVVLAALNSARAKGTLAAGQVQNMSVSHALSDAAVLQLDFNDCATATDMSGSNNNGILTNGPTFVATTYNNRGCAMNFDGVSSQWINVPHNSSLNPTGSATFSFWIYFNGSMPAGSGDIIQKGLGSGLAQYYIRSNVSNGFDFVFSNGTRSYSFNPSYSSLGLSPNIWYYLVYSIDDTAGTAKLYVNGAQKASMSTPSSSVLAQNTGYFAVGGSPWSGYSNVKMDEVRLYARNLSAMEIKREYLAGAVAHGLKLADSE